MADEFDFEFEQVANQGADEPCVCQSRVRGRRSPPSKRAALRTRIPSLCATLRVQGARTWASARSKACGCPAAGRCVPLATHRARAACRPRSLLLCSHFAKPTPSVVMRRIPPRRIRWRTTKPLSRTGQGWVIKTSICSSLHRTSASLNHNSSKASSKASNNSRTFSPRPRPVPRPGPHRPAHRQGRIKGSNSKRYRKPQCQAVR